MSPWQEGSNGPSAAALEDAHDWNYRAAAARQLMVMESLRRNVLTIDSTLMALAQRVPHSDEKLQEEDRTDQHNKTVKRHFVRQTQSR